AIPLSRLKSHSHLPCPNNCLCPICYLQLAENVRHVVAYCVRTEYQMLRNIRVALALSDQIQNFAFAIGQLRKRLGRNGWWRSIEERDHACGDGWAEDGLASAYRSDRT